MSIKRGRGWRRKKNFSKGRRKKKICITVWKHKWYKHDGQYIKGKIHCPYIDSIKTNNRKGHGAATNYKHSDKLKIDSMLYQIKEYEEN